MNYIELINDFWQFYDCNKTKLSVSDIVLYKVLLRYCNKINWLNPFTVNPFLMHEINPLSKNTYYKSFKNLHDIGLILWVKGKNNISNQKVTIRKINTSTNTSTNTSIENSIKFSPTTSPTTSIVTNNKTIKLLNNKTIKLLNKEDFNFLISSKEFKNYLIEENLDLKPKRKKRKVPVKEEIKIPEYSEFAEYAFSKKNNIDPMALKLKYDSWIENNWADGNNNKIANWKSKILNTIPYLKETKTNGLKPPPEKPTDEEIYKQENLSF